jgi:hypothetical protein
MQLLLYVCMRSVYKYSICQTQQLDIHFEGASFHIGDSKDPFVIFVYCVYLLFFANAYVMRILNKTKVFPPASHG